MYFLREIKEQYVYMKLVLQVQSELNQEPEQDYYLFWR